MHVQMTIGTDRVSNPGPLTYVSGALPTALRGPAIKKGQGYVHTPKMQMLLEAT